MEASLSERWLTPRLVAPEPPPAFPAKTPECKQRPQRLEEGAWNHPSGSTLAELAVQARQDGADPRGSSGSFTSSYLSYSSALLPLPVFLLPHLCLGRLPTAGTSNTTSSLSSGSLATPVEGPAEPYTDRTPRNVIASYSLSRQASPAASDGREDGVEYSCRHSCCLEGVYINLNSGTCVKGGLAR